MMFIHYSIEVKQEHTVSFITRVGTHYVCIVAISPFQMFRRLHSEIIYTSADDSPFMTLDEGVRALNAVLAPQDEASGVLQADAHASDHGHPPEQHNECLSVTELVRRSMTAAPTRLPFSLRLRQKMLTVPVGLALALLRLWPRPALFCKAGTTPGSASSQADLEDASCYCPH